MNKGSECKDADSSSQPSPLGNRGAILAAFFLAWLVILIPGPRPFALQGALLEALVERGRLHFEQGRMEGEVFINLETKVPSFRRLFNVKNQGKLFRVNHAPGQFLALAPVYWLCTKLGLRFESHESLVWWILIGGVVGPLGAAGVALGILLLRRFGATMPQALGITAVSLLASPLWASFGVLYHDSLGLGFLLLAAGLGLKRKHATAPLLLALAGALAGWAIVTTYLLGPLALLLLLSLLYLHEERLERAALALAFTTAASVLPIWNLYTYGSALATGYSANGNQANYPAPFDLTNMIEKLGFYLFSPNYGLLFLYPIFALAALALALASRRPSEPRLLRPGLAIALLGHLCFISMMRHHGSVGWGMGRFFLPLYPIAAPGLLFAWQESDPKKAALFRGALCGALLLSLVHGFASAWLGLQGVMEPGLPSLTQVLRARFGLGYDALPWLALTLSVGVGAWLMTSRRGAED